MKPYFEQGDVTLYAGDSRLVLAELEPDSLDSCVTDPPYELTSGGKGGFMGKHWDGTGIAFDPEFWKQVYRVLKPGAHLLAFGGTRTSHRMVCAIEDAGFEIRDSLIWMYGSGFPKSLSVTKATQNVLRDRYGNKTCACLAENELDTGTRCVIGNDAGCENSGENGMQRSGSHQAKNEIGNSDIPLNPLANKNELRELRQGDSAQAKGVQEIEEAVLLEGLCERGTKEAGLRDASLRAGMEKHEGENTSAGQSVPSVSKNAGRKRRSTPRSSPETLPIQRNESSEELSESLRQLPSRNRISDDAGIGLDTDKSFPRKILLDDYAGKQDAMAWVCSWCGLPDPKWLASLEPLGTALKPAHEPIVLARKPLEKGFTVAKNVLRHGTGGLNIDASRVGTEDGSPAYSYPNGPGGSVEQKIFGGLNALPKGVPAIGSSLGRWPANVLLDSEAAKLLDEQSGESVSNIGNRGNMSTDGIFSNSKSWDETLRGHSDSGGASRFFYTAKASRSERNAGTENLEQSNYSMSGADSEKPGDIGLNRKIKRGNGHPTVKPIDLMAYLIKLITPPGGTCIDVFAGSGSTLVAAKRAGFKSIGIEMEPEYCEIIKARCGNVNPLFDV